MYFVQSSVLAVSNIKSGNGSICGLFDLQQFDLRQFVAPIIISSKISQLLFNVRNLPSFSDEKKAIPLLAFYHHSYEYVAHSNTRLKHA